MMIFSWNFSNVNPLKCASLSNQQCKVRTEIININSNEPSFYPCSVKISKFSGSCNNINDPYARMCISDVFKNINHKVFNQMSKTNEKLHETCKCKFRLDASVCNNNVGIEINAGVNVEID